MSRTSFLKRSFSATVVVAIFAALLSPANATHRQETVAVLPDVSISVATGGAPIALISRLPWLAPVVRRQPHQTDVPQHEAVGVGAPATADRQELDRKLIICRDADPLRRDHSPVE